LSKDGLDKTVWHMAADNGRVEVIQKFWDLAKEMKLTPEKLKNGVLLSKGRFDQTA
jgi:hypothetical protein